MDGEEKHNRKTHLKVTQEPGTTLSPAAGLNERSCRTRHIVSVGVCVCGREKGGQRENKNSINMIRKDEKDAEIE